MKFQERIRKISEEIYKTLKKNIDGAFVKI